MIEVDINKVTKAKKGDKNAFSELMQERKADIYRIAFVYAKNSDDALDILQNTVYKAFISIKKLNNVEYFNTWITRICINCCIDFIRKKKRITQKEIKYTEPGEIDNLPESKDDLSQIALSIDMYNAIDKLDENHKAIVILKYYQDLTLSQISDVLSCPIGTVKTRLNRSLGILRLELKEEL
jgi:RNA polymerase sigma-70 factor (ECF subfamily)